VTLGNDPAKHLESTQKIALARVGIGPVVLPLVRTRIRLSVEAFMPLIECRFFLADRNDVHAVEVFAVPILDRADALPCHAPLSIDRAPPKKPWTQMELPSADPNKMVGLFQAQGFQGRQNPSYQHHGQLVPWPLLLTNDPPLRREAAGVVSCFS
jgi:hypothetical protein